MKMSSSDTRIIKDSKLTQGEPVLIARHEFKHFEDSEMEDDSSSNEQSNESATEPVSSPTQEKPFKPKIKLSTGQVQAVVHRSAEEVVRAAQDKANSVLELAAAEAERVKGQAMEEIALLKSKAVDDLALQRIQADEEIAKLKAQTSELARQQGHEAGLRQGMEDAMRQMAEQVKETADRCNVMIVTAEQEAGQIVMEAEPHIIDLVLAIGRKIIIDEVTERPDVVLGLVRNALERVRDQKQINIHISPEDYDFVVKARRELQGIVGAEQSLTITADVVLSKGGCLIETSFGTVEAGVETQLESIRKVLHGMLP